LSSFLRIVAESMGFLTILGSILTQPDTKNEKWDKVVRHPHTYRRAHRKDEQNCRVAFYAIPGESFHNT
jgi:hypothetical protein